MMINFLELKTRGTEKSWARHIGRLGAAFGSRRATHDMTAGRCSNAQNCRRSTVRLWLNSGLLKVWQFCSRGKAISCDVPRSVAALLQ